MTVENNGLQFIWAKVRAVKATGSSNSTNEMSGERDNGDIDKEKNASEEQNRSEQNSEDGDESNNDPTDE